MAEQQVRLLLVCLAAVSYGLLLATGPQLFVRAECEWDEGFPKCCAANSRECGRKLSGNFRMIKCCTEYHFGPRPTDGPDPQPRPTQPPPQDPPQHPPRPSPPPSPTDHELCERRTDLACCYRDSRSCAEELRNDPVKRECCEYLRKVSTPPPNNNNNTEPLREGEKHAEVCLVARHTGVLNYCCPAHSDGRGCSPIQQLLGPCCSDWRPAEGARAGGAVDVHEAYACAKRFQEMASRAMMLGDDDGEEDEHAKLHFPMDCCRVRPFAKTCAAHKHSKRELNRELARSLADSQRKNRQGQGDGKQRLSCSQKCLKSCCKDSEGNMANVTRAAAQVASSRQLLACTFELLQNIISFKLEVPRACCGLPIFSIFCGAQRKEPTPKPGPNNPWSD